MTLKHHTSPDLEFWARPKCSISAILAPGQDTLVFLPLGTAQTGFSPQGRRTNEKMKQISKLGINTKVLKKKVPEIGARASPHKLCTKTTSSHFWYFLWVKTKKSLVYGRLFSKGPRMRVNNFGQEVS